MIVLLIDDHALFAKSLEIVLEDYSQIEKFIVMSDVQNLNNKIRTLNPDIILMDINLGTMSEEDGLLLAKKILDEFPDQKIIILSGYDLPFYQYEAKKIGTRGFVNKNVQPDHLMHILSEIYSDKTYFSCSQTGLIEKLTERELEILRLVSTGMKQKEIASKLFLSERTISNHLQHIFEKLEVSSAVEAVTKALKLGYLSI